MLILVWDMLFWYVYVNSGTKIKSGSSRINTGKQNVNSGKVHVNTARVNRPVLSNQTSNKTKLSQHTSQINMLLRAILGTAVKTSAGCVWRKTTPLSNTNSGPTPDSNVYVSRGPQGRPKPVKAWVTRINWRILKNSIGDLLPLEVLCTNTTNGYQFTMSNQHKDWLVQEQTALELASRTRFMALMVKVWNNHNIHKIMAYGNRQIAISILDGVDSFTKSGCLGDDASKQGRIDIGDINTDAEITFNDENSGEDK
ncbi:hypothetical protein Tco_0038429 [Tanacetum coccineum]